MRSGIGDKGVKHLAALLQKNATLTAIDLRRECIACIGTKGVASAAVPHYPRLVPRAAALSLPTGRQLHRSEGSETPPRGSRAEHCPHGA